MAEPSNESREPRWWVRLCSALWQLLKFVWIPILLGLAINIAATLITSRNFDLTGTPLDWVIHNPLYIGLIGLCLLVLTILVRVVYSLDARSSPHAVSNEEAQQNRTRFLKRLSALYNTNLEQSLWGMARITLGLQKTFNATAHPANMTFRGPDGIEHLIPSKTPVSRVYDDAGDGLLILGEPGAGKSTLLLDLAIALLERAQHDATTSIPVLVSLASWAIKQQPLERWLVEELQLRYFLPPKLTEFWLQNDQLLPLLDGLDEVDEKARLGCIYAINTYRRMHPVPLVVCSRRGEYLSQAGRLALQSAVVIQQLDPQQVKAYLVEAGKPMAAVRTVLQHNKILDELMITPLMLSIIVLAYQGKAVKDLPQMGSAEEQQRQILSSYINRMLEQKKVQLHFSSQQIIGWLTWLARQMQHKHTQTELYLERMQPIWLPTDQAHLDFKLFTGLVLGSVFGLVFGLLGGLFDGLNGGLPGTVLGGLFGFLIMWGAETKSDTEIKLTEALTWSWKSALHAVYGMSSSLRSELNIWLFIGLGLGLLGWMIRGLVGVLVSVLVVGLSLGLLNVLLSGISKTELDERMHFTPNQGIRRSGWTALRIGLSMTFGFGLFGVLLGSLVSWLFGGLSFGLLVGMLFGLLTGLNFGGLAYIEHFVLRFVLWSSKCMPKPWNYLRFLDDATRCILLYRVGGGYRFVHKVFLDYFASLAATSSADKKEEQMPQTSSPEVV